MCDYSLINVRSRPAQVGDKLVTYNFGTGTIGFAGIDGDECAVCLLPGTEIAFADGAVATFRQINKDQQYRHHDALEFALDGKVKLLTSLIAGREATVLQLPAAPRTEQEAQEQRRLEQIG
jgi:hypothetical protein